MNGEKEKIEREDVGSMKMEKRSWEEEDYENEKPQRTFINNVIHQLYVGCEATCPEHSLLIMLDTHPYLQYPIHCNLLIFPLLVLPLLLLYQNKQTQYHDLLRALELIMKKKKNAI